MDATSMDAIFGLFALGCGLYCLYSYYLLKTKKKINDTILLPKGTNIKKCKDLDGYCKVAGRPLLTLGLVTTLYGATDLYNTYIGGADILFVVFLILMVVTIVIFVILVKRYNREYFDIQ